MPVAVLDDELAAAIGAKTRTVQLSRDTLEKQRRNHPDIPEKLYGQLQFLIDGADLVVKDRETALVFVSVSGKSYYFVVKVTQDGQELYLTSLRRAADHERDRVKRRGIVVRERR